MLIYVANQCGIEELSHISIAFLSSFMTKPCGVIYKRGMNMANQLGREMSYWLLSSLFITFNVFSVVLSIEE